LQAAIHEFCQNGHYDRHISTMHRVFRKRMQAAIQALHQYIAPEWADWSEPSGGYLVWLKLKPLTNPPDWESVLVAHGVQALPGNYFFFSETSENYLRLSISKLNEEEITEGIKRLANALQTIYTGE